VIKTLYPANCRCRGDNRLSFLASRRSWTTANVAMPLPLAQPSRKRRKNAHRCKREITFNSPTVGPPIIEIRYFCLCPLPAPGSRQSNAFFLFYPRNVRIGTAQGIDGYGASAVGFRETANAERSRRGWIGSGRDSVIAAARVRPKGPDDAL
jgi:hypothetical protein